MGRRVALTPDQVAEVQKLYNTGRITQKVLAARFEVSTLTIGKVLRKQGVYAVNTMPDEPEHRDPEEPSPSQFDEGVDFPNEQDA